MASGATTQLQLNLPRGWPLLAVAVPLLTLEFLAPALRHTPPEQIPDLTLRLAALLTLPLPLLVLQLITTPPLLATRRLLGETATQTVRASLRQVALWTALLLTVPLVLALVGLVGPAPVLLHVAAVLAGVVPLTSGLSAAAMLHGLRLLAAGRHAGWTAVSGGGAFGPAESAPLLYLPAFALVGALAPVAFLAAVWNARPEWLTATVWLSLPLAGTLLAARIAMTASRRVRRHLHAGLRAAEQAHATRFAQSDGLEEPPLWLTLGRPDAILQFFARAWHRRWPLSGVATVALAIVTSLLVQRDVFPALLVTCIGFAAVAFTRVLSLQSESIWRASVWLGVDARLRRRAYARLGWGLAVPVLVLATILVWRGQGLATIGLGVGALVGWSWMATFWRTPRWIRLGAWLVYGAGLIGAIVGAK